MENRALGKGLSALIPDRKELKSSDIVTYAKTTEIQVNTLQPRSSFDSEKLSELIASIKEKGVLQPILVRRRGERYEIIAGERRFRAAQSLALDEVPVVIKDVTEEDAMAMEKGIMEFK